VKEAAEMLSLSRRTLWLLTKEGKLKAVRYGRAVRYSIDDLRQHVEKQRQASAAEPTKSRPSRKAALAK
jgi:excisionase family DNA binding protein